MRSASPCRSRITSPKPSIPRPRWPCSARWPRPPASTYPTPTSARPPSAPTRPSNARSRSPRRSANLSARWSSSTTPRPPKPRRTRWAACSPRARRCLPPTSWPLSSSTSWPRTRTAPTRRRSKLRRSRLGGGHVPRYLRLAGDGQFPGGVVHPLEAVLGADDNVLDPRTVRPRVDPRLDGERHARLERFVVAGHDVGVLVGLEPDSVAGTVEEGGPEAGLGDRLPRRPGGHPGPHRGARGLLGVVQDLVVGGELGRRLTDDVGAGAVRAVPRGHRAADVHHHDVPGGQPPVGHLVVRAGGVRARPDDHEV